MSTKNFMLSWGMLLVGVIMNVFGVYVIKIKINSIGSVQFNSFMTVVNYFFTLAKSPMVIVGALVLLSAPAPYAIALSSMDLSVAYPASVALNCLIIIPLTVLFLGEALTLYKVAGLTLMVVSLYFLYK